ncbi:MAG: hypothetical protein ACFB6R_13800 [Alphaproteobacteria bacterium]
MFYFDAEWFDQRMAALSLTHGDIAQRLGVTKDVVWATWRGDRALTGDQPRILAGMLGVSEVEVRRRAGLAGGNGHNGTSSGTYPLEPMRVLDDPDFARRFRDLERRIDILDDRLAKLMRHLGCPAD